MEQNPSTQFFGKIRVQFRRYIGVVQRVWWLLPLTVSIGMLIAAVIIFQSPPAFMSISQMAVPARLTLDQGTSADYRRTRPITSTARKRRR